MPSQIQLLWNRPATLLFTLFVVIACRSNANGQATPQPGEILFREAVLLHGESKHSQALDKMKAAVKSASNNAVYLGYAKELEGLVAQDTFYDHALQASAEVEKSIETLAAYLVKPAKNDREKARLIYRWVTDRIVFDEETDAAQLVRDQSAETTLRLRKATCAGYSNLFEGLAKQAGLDAVYIRGQCKSSTGKLTNHAWNAVKLENRWVLVDCTWGSGMHEGQKWAKRFREYYFDVSPEQLAVSHSPNDSQWLLLKTPITKEDFQRWPGVSYRLFERGVKGEEVLGKLQDKQSGGVVQTFFLPPGPRITLVEVPLDRQLQPEKSYKFRIEAPGFVEMVLSDGKKILLKLSKQGPIFEGTIAPPKGNLRVLGLISEKDKQFKGLLAYDVE